ncbi:ATP-binding protein [Bradyrhizobium sp. AS23.2]|uniref:sensor histidine kinase n=1 Tax=Bradyrhizobium sp. AS23.2 TaxID=1680155 RepID=UPI0032DEB662
MRSISPLGRWSPTRKPRCAFLALRGWRVRQIANDIVKDGNRASEIISRIRNLIKKAPPRRDHWEINAAIREVIELTRGEAVKSRVSVQTELADGLLLIRGDRVQLQQVILNLIINAVEAMSGTSEDARELHISAGKANSGGVLVSVRDSGPRLASASFDRLLEPFYTTKPNGLGMGLTICRSIIEAHGGRLWVSANVPSGAIFEFTLPALHLRRRCPGQAQNGGPRTSICQAPRQGK